MNNIRKKFTIKKAKIADIPVILDLIKGLAKYEKLLDSVENNEELIRKKLFGRKKYAEVVLGYENDVVAGFALFFYNYSTFTGKPGLYLEDLFVKKEYRGNGYGKKLLLHLVKIANKNDCARMEWVVLDWNQPAIDFYNALGAFPMSGWTIYRLDANKLGQISKKREANRKIR